MHKVNQDELLNLINKAASGPAITIYLPTHKASTPPNMSEDQTRFKNLYKKALDILNNRDKNNIFNKDFEQNCYELLEDRTFWENSSESKLLCARPGIFKYFHLPVDSEEFVAVSDHFFLAPVLGLLNEFTDYYVLQVSIRNPQLYKGDAYGLEPSGIDLPESLEEALNIDEMHQKSVQHHSISGPKSSEFHGHGGGKDTGDSERLQYFRAIDSIVFKKTDKKLPMVLVGENNELRQYRDVSRYPALLEKTIDGHYTYKDVSKLREQAKEVVLKELVEQSHKEVMARFDELKGSPGMVSERTADIKDAAEKGRVGTLLIAMTKKTRDTVRDNLDQVRKIVFPSEVSSQSLEHISSQVTGNGGKIINLTDEEMLGNNLVLSINRY